MAVRSTRLATLLVAFACLLPILPGLAVTSSLAASPCVAPEAPLLAEQGACGIPATEPVSGPAPPSSERTAPPAPDQVPIQGPVPPPLLPKDPRDLLGPEMTAQASLSGTGFQGATQDEANSYPPDTNGAVGPNHVITMLNGLFKIQQRNGAVVGTPQTLDAFWGVTGTTDPHAVYDPYGGRFLVSTITCCNTDSGPSKILFGASTSSDPTAGFIKATWLSSDSTGNCAGDYDQMGFNKDWLVITVHLVNPDGKSTCASAGAVEVFIIDKAKLYANQNPGDYSIGPFSDICPPTNCDADNPLIPADTYDSTTNTIYLVNEYSRSLGQLQVRALTGSPPNAPTLGNAVYPQAPSGWSDPGGVQVPQSGNSQPIAPGGDKVENVVYRNGALFVAQTVGLGSPTRASVQWWQINPASTTPTQFGRIDDATYHRYMPTIAANANGDVLLGYTRSSAGTNAGAYFAWRSATDTLGATTNDLTLGEGTDGPALGYLDYGRWHEVSRGVNYFETNQRLEMTVQENTAGKTIVNVESKQSNGNPISATFDATHGVDARVDMARNLPGSQGSVGRPTLALVRGNDATKWVEIYEDPFYGVVRLKDSAGTSLVLATTTPASGAFHNVRIVLTGSSYTGYFDSTSLTVASTLFSGATSFRMQLQHWTGGSSTGLLETAAFDNAIVYQSGTGTVLFQDDFNGAVRWGDYSVTTVDPNNDRDMWTIQEYGWTSNKYATWWGDVLFGPSNDNFASSFLASSAPYTSTESTAGSTTESGEPLPACEFSGSIGATVWYRYTPVSSGTVTVDTFGSSYDTVLNVYTGSSLTGLTRVACNDQSGGDQSQTSFAATGGTTYRIQVAGWFSVTGNLVLHVNCSPGNCAPTPPSVPQSLTASAGPGVGQIALSWSAPASNGGSAITNYRVWRSTVSGGPYTLIATLGNVLSYTDSGLGNAATRYYVVTAVNAIGESLLSNQAGATTWTTPGAPQSFGASAGPGAGQITLSWSGPASNGGTSVTSYKVYRSTTSGGPYTLVATLGAVLSYTDSGLGNGATRYYVVSAVNAVGEGPQTGQAGATTFVLPGAPQSLAAAAGPGAGQIRLTWSAPASNGGAAITGYKVYRSTTSGGPYSLVTTLGNVLTYTDSGLGNAVTRYYVVSAVNVVGEGPQSGQASATTFTTPTAPQSLTATAGPSPGQIALSWSAPASNGGLAVTNYKVYRATTSGGPYSLVTTVGNVLSYTDSGLGNGATRYYVVSAVNAAGEGPQSSQASATTFTPPSAPLGLTATPGPGVQQIKLDWSAPASNGGTPITGYKVYRATVSGGPYTNIASTPSGTLTYTDSGLTLLTTYYYVVKASNAAGDSANSNQACAKPYPSPGGC